MILLQELYGNALCIEEEGVIALIRICNYSPSKMARFMTSLTLAYFFDSKLINPINSA